MEINSKTETNAKVTIICVTYNQEEYIEQCLDSLVSQKTNFEYQIFVGEDCSTDNTREIVKRYAEKYSIIVPFLREKNLGSTENFCDLCERVNTPYFAFCDGDDFWTDNNRLQKQFDFMEKNPTFNGCFCRASIKVEGNWGLEEFYRKKRQKNLVWPDCQPGFKKRLSTYTAKEMAEYLPAQAVNVFLRRNTKMERLPQWMHEIYICDAPLIFLHIGKGKLKFMKENMCTYRRSTKGIFYSESKNDHMIKTRPQYIKYFSSLRNFFMKWYGGIAKVEFENRLKLEIYNYFNALMSKGKIEDISRFISQNPEVSKIAMNAYLSFYNDQRRFVSRFNWESYKLVMRSTKIQVLIYPLLKTIVSFKDFVTKTQRGLRKAKGKIRKFLKNVAGFTFYHISSLIPKKKNKWVFTSFKQQGYLDNSKYFFEYVVANYPEINAVWVTRDKKVISDLTQKGYKCYQARSFRGFLEVATSYLAITDHFRMTDYPSVLGFNSKTRVVQLWHGVGFKSMGNKEEVKNTTIPGVVYSYDIIPSAEDSFSTRLKKRVKRFFTAHTRELFEEYFAFVCPGQERVDMIGEMWNIPEERYIYAGHPRNKPVYEAMKKRKKQDKYNVMYAPTYRIGAGYELELVERFVRAMPSIQKAMEKINGIFTLRMHPHTWRSYSSKISEEMKKYNRIVQSVEKDIYPTLANYDMLIADYSSISLDFALFGRPVIYLIEDFERFCEKDAGFNLDFLKMSPGPKAKSWNEVFKLINEYRSNGKWGSQATYNKALKYFFNKEVNSIDNSKVIADELLRRLGEK